MGAQTWGAAFHTGAVVGMCMAGERPQWLVWKSLEYAANHAGSCFEREPEDELAELRPRCAFYDFTADSGAREYPKDCVYYGQPNCPISKNLSR